MRPPKKGFTLIELMVVVFIVAILLTLTFPGYQKQLWKTRRALGSAQLREVMLRQEQFFMDHKHYAGNLSDLDFPASPYAIDAEGNTLSAMAENRIYLIDIATYNNGFTLYATPQLSQASDNLCGTLSLDLQGVKLVTGVWAAPQCW